MTRPEPTIYGNCDSWDLIVGRKPAEVSPHPAWALPLQVNDNIVIHSLLTIWLEENQDNLWAICGSICTSQEASHMVEKLPLFMPIFTDSYPDLD